MLRKLATIVLFIVSGFTIVAIGTSSQADEARWYKGNLHTHSLWSDGNDFPEMIVDWYVQHGYDFLSLSDHNILSRGEKWIGEDQALKRGAIDGLKRYRARFGNEWVETREKTPPTDTPDAEKTTEIRLKTFEEFSPLFDKPGEFLMIQAEEITDHFGSLPIHINANNIAELIRPQGGESVRKTIAKNLIAVQQQSQRVGQPIFAHLNHPNFGYAVTAEDMAAVVQERFFEVYNGHPGVNQLGDETHASIERMWDIANTIRIADMKHPPLYGMGTDDSHNYFGNRGASTGRGWVMVRAAELTPEALIRSMEAGDFYVSSGVTLESHVFDSEKQTLSVVIAAEEGVEYVTEFIGTPVDYDNASQPVVDKDGKEIVATRTYSADVGKVLAQVNGTTATYQLTGKELYVRATVTSTKKHWNPSFDNQTEQAWTQPVGWENRVQD
ncbi:MAG: hypothetical protein KDB05_28035 [Planctomycetales bacterium]|nr:hypothetical protein [Planctomycetales bacterium]